MQWEDMRPEIVITKEHLASYEMEIDGLYSQLIALHSGVYVLREIETFPFALFQGGIDLRSPFWWVVKRALIYESIMIVWRIIDEDKYLTFMRVKKGILSHLIAEGHRQVIEDAFRAERFDERCEEIKSQIEKVRHNFVGHLQYKINVRLDSQQIAQMAISLSGLEKLRDELKLLFDLLCLNCDRSLALVNLENDVEEFFDALAKNSPFLNSPEENRQMWDTQRKRLSQKDLDILNKYRRKFSLPEV
ncbi:MAG: hypothetical protein JXB47_19845 [Anaerolineae bacterium]|nr:hypothetical protein [Anaerolineae bacterium]